MNKYGQLCYTYYLYHVPTGKKYYGYRVANKCEPTEDLWHTYFASSVLVDELVKQYGTASFIAEVRKTFETREETFSWEQRVIDRIKAVERDDWLNQSLARGPFYSYHWTERRRRNASIKMKGNKNALGYKHPPEQRNTKSKQNKGKSFHTPEQKIKHSKFMMGKTFAAGLKHTEEWKKSKSQNMKGNSNAKGSKGNKHTADMNLLKSQRTTKMWIRLKGNGYIRPPHSAERNNNAGKAIKEIWNYKRSIINYILINRWNLETSDTFLIQFRRHTKPRNYHVCVQLFPYIPMKCGEFVDIHHINLFSSGLIKLPNVQASTGTHT